MHPAERSMYPAVITYFSAGVFISTGKHAEYLKDRRLQTDNNQIENATRSLALTPQPALSTIVRNISKPNNESKLLPQCHFIG